MGKSSISPARRKPSPQRVRRLLIQRWLELAQDLTHLENAFRNAPRGAFAGWELKEASLALDVVWDQLANRRPRFSPSDRTRRLAWAMCLERLAAK